MNDEVTKRIEYERNEAIQCLRSVAGRNDVGPGAKVDIKMTLRRIQNRPSAKELMGKKKGE